MDVDKASSIGTDAAPGELKIKGQAEFERRKSKWDVAEGDDIDLNRNELVQRENELKEKALRNKVMRRRKRSR